MGRGRSAPDGELGLGKAGRAHPFEAPCAGYFGAERADIKAFRAQGRAERWIVYPRLMREQGDRRIVIDFEPGQRRFGPFGGNWRFGKSLRRRESSARIDDDHLEAGKVRRHGERLRDIRCADREKPHGRSLDIEKQPPAGMLDQGASPLPQSRFDEFVQRIFGHFVRADQSLFAGVDIRDKHAGTPGGAFTGEPFLARLKSIRAQEAVNRFGVDAQLGPDRLFHRVDEAPPTQSQRSP